MLLRSNSQSTVGQRNNLTQKREPRDKEVDSGASLPNGSATKKSEARKRHSGGRVCNGHSTPAKALPDIAALGLKLEAANCERDRQAEMARRLSEDFHRARTDLCAEREQRAQAEKGLAEVSQDRDAWRESAVARENRLRQAAEEKRRAAAQLVDLGRLISDLDARSVLPEWGEFDMQRSVNALVQEDVEAAVHIQRVARGKKARAEVADAKRLRVARQQALREAKETEKARMETLAAARIQAVHRGNTSRRALADRSGSALAVEQSTVATIQHSQSTTGMDAEMGGMAMVDIEAQRTVAATRIQNSQRALQARRRAATKRHQRALRPEEEDDVHELLQSFLQSSMRASRSPYAVVNSAPFCDQPSEQRKVVAATKIQSIHRGRQVRFDATFMGYMRPLSPDAEVDAKSAVEHCHERSQELSRRLSYPIEIEGKSLKGHSLDDLVQPVETTRDGRLTQVLEHCTEPGDIRAVEWDTATAGNTSKEECEGGVDQVTPDLESLSEPLRRISAKAEVAGVQVKRSSILRKSEDDIASSSASPSPSGSARRVSFQDDVEDNPERKRNTFRTPTGCVDLRPPSAEHVEHAEAQELVERGSPMKQRNLPVYSDNEELFLEQVPTVKSSISSASVDSFTEDCLDQALSMPASACNDKRRRVSFEQSVTNKGQHETVACRYQRAPTAFGHFQPQPTEEDVEEEVTTLVAPDEKSSILTQNELGLYSASDKCSSTRHLSFENEEVGKEETVKRCTFIRKPTGFEKSEENLEEHEVGMQEEEPKMEQVTEDTSGGSRGG